MAYLPLSTANLPDPAIDPAQGSSPQDYFNTVLWDGNGVSPRSITGVGFEPSLVWLKPRSNTFNHRLMNAVSGANKMLFSNKTDAEQTDEHYGYLTSFDSDGFTMVTGSTGDDGTNDSGDTYVAWNWKANGSGVSNTDGSITSTVSANTESGFSIVKWSGNTTDGATVGHGLDQQLEFCTIKNLTTGSTNWHSKHSALSGENSIFLNLTNAAAVTGGGNPTFPDASTIQLNAGTGGDSGLRGINFSGDDYIAYCFHSVEGFSKFGSYTGNGSTDGPFVYTGFRPAFVLFKSASSTNGWFLMDTTRDTSNLTQIFLRPNASDAEGTAANSVADYLSNGFKLRGVGGDVNGSGNTYIYMAFAENPFKYSNAR